MEVDIRVGYQERSHSLDIEPARYARIARVRAVDDVGTP